MAAAADMPAPTIEEVRAYLAEHNVSVKLQKALNKAVSCRATDPIAFIVEILSQPNSGLDIMAG